MPNVREAITENIGAMFENEIAEVPTPTQYIIDSSERAINRAREAGYVGIVPDDKTLLIDIDSEEQYVGFGIRFARMARSIPATIIYNNPSKSGLPRRHIGIELEQPLPILNRLFLQLYLSSDPTREFLSYLRFMQGDPNPSILFELNPRSNEDE